MGIPDIREVLYGDADGRWMIVRGPAALETGGHLDVMFTGGLPEIGLRRLMHLGDPAEVADRHHLILAAPAQDWTDMVKAEFAQRTLAVTRAEHWTAPQLTDALRQHVQRMRSIRVLSVKGWASALSWTTVRHAFPGVTQAQVIDALQAIAAEPVEWPAP